MKFVLILILFSFFTLAQDTKTCDTDHFHDIHQLLTRFDDIKELANLGVCPVQTLDSKIHEKYMSFTQPVVTNFVGGIPLKGSNVQAKIFKELIGDNPPEDWKSQIEDCTTIKCAAIKLYGDYETAKAAFVINNKFGYNLSLSSLDKDHPGKWTLHSAQVVYKSLVKLPPKFRNLPTLKDFYTMPDDYTIHDHYKETNPYYKNTFTDTAAIASYGDKSIVFNNLVWKYDDNVNSPETLKTVVHEVGHHFDYSNHNNTGYYLSTESKFTSINGWDEVAGKWIFDKNKACFTTEYSETNPKEHFAESVQDYVFHPHNFKQKCPENYNFVKKNVFDDIEFLQDFQKPEIDHLIEEKGINLAQCYKPQINSILIDSGTLYFNAPSSGNYSTLYEGKPDRQCIYDQIIDVIDYLDDGEDFCKNGGTKAIVDYLFQKLSAIESFFEVEASNFVYNNPDILSKLAKECLKNYQLTYQCISNKLTDEVKGILHKDILKNEIYGKYFMGQLPEQTFKNMIINQPQMFTPMLKKNAGKYISACVDSFKKIKVDDGQLRYFSTRNYYFNGVRTSDCRKGIGEKSFPNGEIDYDFQVNIQNSKFFNEDLKDFEQKIVNNYTSIKDNCKTLVGPNRECFYNELYKLLSNSSYNESSRKDIAKIYSDKLQ